MSIPDNTQQAMVSYIEQIRKLVKNFPDISEEEMIDAICKLQNITINGFNIPQEVKLKLDQLVIARLLLHCARLTNIIEDNQTLTMN